MEELMTADTKLRVLRIGRKWSQDQVAEKIGVTQAAYAKLEAGKTRLTIDRAQQLADVYEIEPEYFFSSHTSAIHYNTGINSHSNSVFHPKNYIDINYESDKTIFDLILCEKDKALKEKDEQIHFLISTLENVQNEKKKLLQLLEKKLTIKS